MHQIDTSLTMYALEQAEAFFSQSNAIFDQMIDDSLALNQAIMNLYFVEITQAETFEVLFPYVARGSVKKKSAQPKNTSDPKVNAQMPTSHDNLKLISGIGPSLEKKLRDAGITSYSQIAALTSAEIIDLEANVVRFTGRIKRDDWIGQAQVLMNS
ncbi:MAG: hypothetical protein VXX88_04320 [Pseudomonadota bacterium]|nr:hypothetical protein [Pseudomonadota bacterium]